VVLFAGMKDAMWQLLVPVLGQQVVFGRIVRGDALTANDWVVPSVIAFAIAAACVALVARLLREERIVFGR
jgi:sodium transport system permease protein